MAQAAAVTTKPILTLYRRVTIFPPSTTFSVRSYVVFGPRTLLLRCRWQTLEGNKTRRVLTRLDRRRQELIRSVHQA